MNHDTPPSLGPARHRTGTVALIGRPNAGKSTLLNQLVGGKLAITSSKPQTTRDRIVGILNADGLQAILTDTPGLHPAWTELNKAMVKRAQAAAEEADVVLWLLDMAAAAGRLKRGEPVFDEVDDGVVEVLKGVNKPILLLPNKLDAVEVLNVLPVIDAARNAVKVAAAVPISAKTGDGVDALMTELSRWLPAGPPLYDTDTWTEASERFLCAEIIRERIFHLTSKEIPYATHVEVERFDESEREGRGLVRIHAVVIVERASQKGILIGKGGEMMKKVGTQARLEIEKLLGCKAHLELFVKVEKDWTKTEKGLRRVGFGR